MSTAESPMIRQLWQAIHRFEPRAEFGGSVPDLATELRHSYHRSWQDSPHDDGYSVHYFGDRARIVLAGKTGYAAALDVTLPDPALMRKYTARLHHLAETAGPLNLSHGLREFAGTLDSEEVFAMDTTRVVRTFGWDESHLWHIHLSINRRFVTSRRILKIAAVFDD
jgi:hypothetical protein